MTTAERLVARLRATRALEPFGITMPEGTTAQRRYTGVWERRHGAWVWDLRGPDGSPFLTDRDGRKVMIGSSCRMRSLLAADEWTVDQTYGTDINVDPA